MVESKLEMAAREYREARGEVERLDAVADEKSREAMDASLAAAAAAKRLREARDALLVAAAPPAPEAT